MFYFFRPRKTHQSSRTDYRARKNAARKLVVSRLEHFAAEYALLDPALALSMKYKRVSVRNQRSRWGSCSAQKNLNFNYRLARLPPDLRDYVIVHELCHLVELNHGPKFWVLVERMIPNARELSRKVRRVEIN